MQAHDLIVEAEVREGRPSEVILDRSAELAADLLVIGAKGLSAPGEFQLGSTAHKLVHYAGCSVLVARPAERAQPINIILAADGSIEAQRAAEFLCTLSLRDWAEVTVVGVDEARAGLPRGNRLAERRPVADVPESLRHALFEAAEAHVSELVACLRGCRARVLSAVCFGHPTEKILDAAHEHDADLIVVGARGQTRAEPFRLGGVAQKVVKYAPCSVLVVRQGERSLLAIIPHWLKDAMFIALCELLLFLFWCLVAIHWLFAQGIRRAVSLVRGFGHVQHRI